MKYKIGDILTLEVKRFKQGKFRYVITLPIVAISKTWGNCETVYHLQRGSFDIRGIGDEEDDFDILEATNIDLIAGGKYSDVILSEPGRDREDYPVTIISCNDAS